MFCQDEIAVGVLSAAAWFDPVQLAGGAAAQGIDWTFRSTHSHTRPLEAGDPAARHGGISPETATTMFDVAISELTSVRWELHEELAHAAAVGFDALALWRPKVTDAGVAETARLLAGAGIAASSLQWAGGFTGGDGRSFTESIADAADAIAVAEAVGAPVLVVHSGCRGGHTRSHAMRLLSQALETLAPRAARAGVTLAIRPIHPRVAPGCSFVTRLAEAVELVEHCDDAAVRLAVDLCHFGDDDGIADLVPRLAAAAAVVQVADRSGPAAAASDRLPVDSGRLPLERLVAGMVEAGYRGAVEFDPVGEAVESMGYEAAWRQIRATADRWRARLAADALCGPGTRVGHAPAGIHLRPAASAGAAG